MSAATQVAIREALYDVDTRTGASIEVFYADRALETFGRRGAGWFWWYRRRGFSPECSATGPFPTSYSAYRDALNRGEPIVLFGRGNGDADGALGPRCRLQTTPKKADRAIKPNPQR